MRFGRLVLVLALVLAAPRFAHGGQISFFGSDWHEARFGEEGLDLPFALVFSFLPEEIRGTYTFVSPTLLEFESPSGGPMESMSFYTFAPATLVANLRLTDADGHVTEGTFTTVMDGNLFLPVTEDETAAEGIHTFSNVGFGPGLFSPELARAMNISPHSPYGSGQVFIEHIFPYDGGPRTGNMKVEFHIEVQVPEPGTTALFGAAAAAALARRRMKKARGCTR